MILIGRLGVVFHERITLVNYTLKITKRRRTKFENECFLKAYTFLGTQTF